MSPIVISAVFFFLNPKVICVVIFSPCSMVLSPPLFPQLFPPLFPIIFLLVVRYLLVVVHHFSVASCMAFSSSYMIIACYTAAFEPKKNNSQAH